MIIAITGKKRHGKDTVAFIMTHLIDGDVVVDKFAQPLVDTYKTLTGKDYQNMSSEEKDNCRPDLYRLSKGIKDSLGENCFTESTILRANGRTEHTVISDLRLEDELNSIRSVSGSKSLWVRVVRFITGDKVLVHDGVKERSSKVVSCCGEYVDVMYDETKNTYRYHREEVKHISDDDKYESELDNVNMYKIYNTGSIFDLEKEVKEFLVCRSVC